MKKFLLFLLAAVAGFAIYSYWPEKEIRHPAGILISEEPVQRTVAGLAAWQKDEFLITPIAEYKIKAIVLSRKNYFPIGKESSISPLDLALGWGVMSDQSIIDQLKITQRNRWYHWETERLPVQAREISKHSSNVHIIPSNETIEEDLDKIYRGSLVEMTGYLVDIKAEGGWHWRSSLRRDDTGGGACELFWVDNVQIMN